jgi:hypothetical protein
MRGGDLRREFALAPTDFPAAPPQLFEARMSARAVQLFDLLCDGVTNTGALPGGLSLSTGGVLSGTLPEVLLRTSRSPLLNHCG